MDFYELPGRAGPLSLSGDIYAAREVVHLSLSEIRDALFMKQGMLEINGPLWSLYIEAKLYVLYACAIALISGRCSLVRMPALAALCFLMAKLGLESNPDFAAYAAIWLTGALAYYVWNERSGWLSRLLLCGGLILLIIVTEGWRALQSGNAPWLIARNVLVAAAIAWLLFRLRIRVPVSQRLADCSYSLYATHFPILLLAQSLLLSTGSSSFVAAIAVAILSTTAAALVALVGGAVEAKKSAVQHLLLNSVSYAQRTWSRISGARQV
jgi:peptidoglycan/LPS O-acetylase OafA/YrhL